MSPPWLCGVLSSSQCFKSNGTITGTFLEISFYKEIQV